MRFTAEYCMDSVRKLGFLWLIMCILCDCPVKWIDLKGKSRKKWPIFLIGQFELAYFLEMKPEITAHFFPGAI